MGFSSIYAVWFHAKYPASYQKVRECVQNIIQVDPTGQKDLLKDAEVVQVSTEVVKLKSLIQTYPEVSTFMKKFGTFDSTYTGEYKQTLLQFLTDIDDTHCGATTVHIFLPVWEALTPTFDPF